MGKWSNTPSRTQNPEELIGPRSEEISKNGFVIEGDHLDPSTVIVGVDDPTDDETGNITVHRSNRSPGLRCERSDPEGERSWKRGRRENPVTPSQ